MFVFFKNSKYFARVSFIWNLVKLLGFGWTHFLKNSFTFENQLLKTNFWRFNCHVEKEQSPNEFAPQMSFLDPCVRWELKMYILNIFVDAVDGYLLMPLYSEDGAVTAEREDRYCAAPTGLLDERVLLREIRQGRARNRKPLRPPHFHDKPL